MTGYAVRRIGDQAWWAGVKDAWSPRADDAVTFASYCLAIGIATRDCPTNPDLYTIEPVLVEDSAAFWREAA